MIKLRKIRRRQHTLAYGVLAAVAFAAAIPAVLGSRGPLLGLSGSALIAAARDRHSITSPIPLVPSSGLTLDRGTVSLATAQNRPIKNAEAILKLLISGASRLVLEDAVIGFAAPGMPGAGGGALDAGEALPPLVSALLEARFEQLSLRRATLELRDRDGRVRWINDLNATILAKRNGTVTAQGSFDYLGRTVSFDTTLSLGDRSSTTRIPLRAAFKSDLVEVNLPEARLSLSNGWQLSSQRATIALADVRRAARWLGSDWPDGPGLAAAKVEGTLDAASQTLAFQRARIELDGNEATGALLVNLAGQRPAVEATLALQNLDVTRYLPAPWTAPPRPRNSDAAAVPALALASEPQALAFPILRFFDADLRLSAGRVSAGQIALGRCAATITLKAGKLAADLAEIEIDNSARGNAQISIDMAGVAPRYGIRASLSNLEMEGLARIISGQALIRGAGRLLADVSGTGDSLIPLASTLSGKVALRLPAGGSIALDLPALLAAAQSKSDEDAWTVAVGGRTVVDALEANLHVAQGVWTSESLSARTGNAVINATGLVDLPGGEVDMVVTRSNANKGVDFTGASTPASMAHIRGALGAPRVMPAVKSKKANEQSDPGWTKLR